VEDVADGAPELHKNSFPWANHDRSVRSPDLKELEDCNEYHQKGDLEQYPDHRELVEHMDVVEAMDPMGRMEGVPLVELGTHTPCHPIRPMVPPSTAGTVVANPDESGLLNIPDRRGTIRSAESQGEEHGSVGSGSRKRNRTLRPDQRSMEVKAASRALILPWFEKHDMVYLKRQYLNQGEHGLQRAKADMRIILLEGLSGDEFQDDRNKFGRGSWSTWIDEKVTEAIHNCTLTYDATYGLGSSSSGGTSDLYEKLKKWKEGVNLVKARGRTVLPAYIGKELADRIATQARQGVVWLPKNATIIAQDTSTFQGRFGIVRRVCIQDASFIPSWIEFAGKTMKAKNNLENREERSTEALKSYESYCLWWNGGSLKNMRNYDKTIAEVHESEILRNSGLDYGARKQLVTYRKHRAYLAWALMCIEDVMHKDDVMHNDLNLNNIMLHFPRDDDKVVQIGIRD
ncbi:MAG: hypothetical protein Q9211_007132, partial [Gyalolechia sp. 1 TL-2023]